MNRTITYFISDKDAGFTIEQNLRHRGYSAKNITHLKKTPESVLLNGIWVHMTHRLTSGDELVIHRGAKLGYTAPDERYFADTPERYYEPFGAVMPGLAHQEITLLKQERVK